MLFVRIPIAKCRDANETCFARNSNFDGLGGPGTSFAAQRDS